MIGALLITFALILVATTTRALGQGRLASPVVAYGAVWLIVIGIHLSGVMTYYDLHAPALLAMVAGSSAFIGGAWLAGRKAQPDTIGSALPPVRLIAPGVIAIGLLTAFFGIAWVSQQLHGTVNVLRAWSDGTVDRSLLLLEFAAQLDEGSRVSAVLGVASGLLTLCQIWAAVHLAQRRSLPNRPGDALVVAVVAVTGYAALTMAAKAPIIGFASYAAIAAAFAHEGRQRGTSRASMVLRVAALVVIVAGSWMLNVRQNQIRGTISTLSDERTDLHPVVFSTLLYISAPSVAFSEDWKQNLADNEGLSVSHSLAPLAKWLGRVGLQGDTEQTIYKQYIHTPYYINTYTWFYSFRRDAGIAGLILFPFVIGLVAGRLYSAAVRRREFVSVAAYLLLGHAVMLSFFAWSLVATSQFALIAALVAIGTRRGRTRVTRRPLWRVNDRETPAGMASPAVVAP